MSSLNENKNLTLTDSAIDRISKLIVEEGSDCALRISVSGGGCSGFQYNFKMDSLSSESEEYEEDEDDYEEDEDDYEDDEVGSGSKDESYEVSGKTVLLVDKKSSQFLRGSVVDYVEDLNGSGFRINNPEAKSKCGCGNSFSI